MVEQPSFFLSDVVLLYGVEYSLYFVCASRHGSLLVLFRFTVQDDITTNTSVVDGRLSLAPVMSKKELRKGFAISAPVPFIKSGTLKARITQWRHRQVYRRRIRRSSSLVYFFHTLVCCCLDLSVSAVAAGRAVFPCGAWMAGGACAASSQLDQVVRSIPTPHQGRHVVVAVACGHVG